MKAPLKGGMVRMKVVLVDDEQLALDYFEKQLNKVADVTEMTSFTNPLEVEAFVSANDVNVAFLDVNMPEMGGIELAERLLGLKPHLTIVFVTAYDEYALEAFEINALDYILKPISEERLQKTINRVNERLKMVNTEEIAEAPNEHLKIRLCDYLSFQLSDGEVKVVQWRTSRAQELFLYLLQNNKQHVRKEALIDILWENETTEGSLQHLYTTVYHVRQALRPFHNYFKLKNTSEGYFLQVKNIEVDLWKWEDELGELGPLNEINHEQYERVMSIAKGPYLSEYDYIWLEPERQRYEQLWIKQALKLAQFYYEKGLNDEAKQWCKRVLEVDPIYEEATLLLMKVYAASNSDLLVQQEYYVLVERLESQVNAKPNKKVEEWFRHWEKVTFKKS